MNTLEAIYSRQSIRSYTGEKISKEELEVILKAANAAPVGRAQYDTVNLTVITNAELLNKIDSATAAIFGDPSIHPLYGAPTMILVSAKAPTAPAMQNITYSNAAIIAHNMALAATELGVGVCHIWGAMGALAANPELVKEFNLPEGFIPCCAVIIGKTNHEYAVREIPNRISLNTIE